MRTFCHVLTKKFIRNFSDEPIGHSEAPVEVSEKGLIEIEISKKCVCELELFGCPQWTHTDSVCKTELPGNYMAI